MTTLTETMTDLRGKVRVTSHGAHEYLVALLHGRDWIVGFRLQRDSLHSPWRVTETGLLRRGAAANMNGNDIRELPLGELMARARRVVSDAISGTADPGKVTRPSVVNLSAFAHRGGRTDQDYACLALRYVEIVQSGDRKPSERLAREAGFGTAGTWTNRVVEARKRGVLSPGRRGEAGGSLTRKAERLLYGSE